MGAEQAGRAARYAPVEQKRRWFARLVPHTQHVNGLEHGLIFGTDTIGVIAPLRRLAGETMPIAALLGRRHRARLHVVSGITGAGQGCSHFARIQPGSQGGIGQGLPDC